MVTVIKFLMEAIIFCAVPCVWNVQDMYQVNLPVQVSPSVNSFSISLYVEFTFWDVHVKQLSVAGSDKSDFFRVL